MLEILNHILNLPVWSIILIIVFAACCGMLIGLMIPIDTDEYRQGREDAFREMTERWLEEDKQ